MPLKHTVEEIVLKNGARGLLIDIPDSTVVAYDVHFRAGNYYAPSPELQQTAHILEHMVFGSTKKYPSIELYSQEFTRNGAYNNATTWEYGMSYYADCAALEWDRILDLQRQAITEPVFTQQVLTAEKGNVTEELTGRATHYGRVLWQNLYKQMGDKGLTDPEKIATIPAVTLSHIEHHHKTTHTLRNMRFCFAGDLGKHREKIIKDLEAWQLPVGERLDIPSVPMHSCEPLCITKQELPSIIFALSFVLNRTLTDKEESTMAAINHIIAGTFHSRVWGEARKRGICYGMNAAFDVSPDNASSWELSGQIRPQNALEMITLIAEQLAKIAAGDISSKELQEAKQYGLGAFQMRAQTVRAVSNWYAGEYFNQGTINHIERRPEAIKAVTRSQIQKLVREFLAEGEWGIGAIGNIKAKDVQQLDSIIATIAKKR